MTVHEEFKPVTVRYDGSWTGRVLFAIRCLVDLQVRTVYAFLRHTVPAMKGKVLDVGCGESPYAHLLTAGASDTGIRRARREKVGVRALSAPDIEHLTFHRRDGVPQKGVNGSYLQIDEAADGEQNAARPGSIVSYSDGLKFFMHGHFCTSFPVS